MSFHQCVKFFSKQFENSKSNSQFNLLEELKKLYVTALYFQNKPRPVHIFFNRDILFSHDLPYYLEDYNLIKKEIIGKALAVALKEQSGILYFIYKEDDETDEFEFIIKDNFHPKEEKENKKDVFKMKIKTLLDKLIKYHGHVVDQMNDPEFLDNYERKYNKCKESGDKMKRISLPFNRFRVPLSPEAMDLLTYEALTDSSVDPNTFIWSTELHVCFFRI